MNEKRTKIFVPIFENPSKLIPSSSGNGEARMNPAIKKVIHLCAFNFIKI